MYPSAPPAAPEPARAPPDLEVTAVEALGRPAFWIHHSGAEARREPAPLIVLSQALLRTLLRAARRLPAKRRRVVGRRRLDIRV